MRLHRRVDPVDPRLDQMRRVIGESEPRLRRVDASLGRGRFDRLVGPSVERGILADLERKLAADSGERGVGSVHRPQLLACGAGFKRTSNSAATIIAAPTPSSAVSVSP